jgi:NitT/TauT family transport system substrate-binding protein
MAVTYVFKASVAALVMFLFAIVAPRAEPVKIRIGWIGAPGQLVPFMFAKEGLAKHLGQSYTFEPLHFAASPLQISALAAGELEIATLGFSSIAFAVQNAGIEDIRAIADEIEDGAEGYFSTHYVVLKDSPIQKIEDLKGKIVATNGIGAGVDILMRAVLKKHGLEDRRDFTTIEAQFPNMRAVLTDHKADLVTATLPFAYDPEMEKVSRTLFLGREAFGPADLSFWTARASFIEKNRAALLDLLEDYVRAIRWYMDPKNHDEAVQIVTKTMKLQPAVFARWVFTNDDWYRNLDGLPNLEALQRNVNSQKELGFIKADFKVDPYADLTLVREGAARLK